MIQLGGILIEFGIPRKLVRVFFLVMDSTRVSPSGIPQDIYSIFYSLVYLFIYSKYSCGCVTLEYHWMVCLWNLAWLWLILQHFEEAFEEPRDFHCIYVIFYYRR